MRRTLLYCLLGLAAGAVGGQLPDSPTGRMAEALATLAASGEVAALEEFLQSRVAPDRREALRAELAGLQRECGGGEIAGARKTGEESATIVLELPDGRCEIDFTLEGSPHHRLTGLGVGVLLGEAPGGWGPTLDLPTGDDAALVAALDRRLERLASDDAFSGVVLLARDGGVLFQRAYGMADREEGVRNTVDTRFDVGSITKLLTRIAVAQLAQSGALDLRATLLEVLPDYPNRQVAERITIEQLLDHSSGLGDLFGRRWEAADKSRLVRPRDFFPLFVDEPLAFEPGSSRSYSNAGFIVLGAVVEEVSGTSYADYLAERVLRPAGMDPAAFPRRDGSVEGVAVGYTRGPDGSGELRPNFGLLPIRGCPAGSSSHTAADLLALERALRGGRLLDRPWTAWVYTGERRPLGADEPPSWPIGVAGGGPGVSALLEGDADATVVVLSNFDPPTAERLGLEIFAALSGS